MKSKIYILVLASGLVACGGSGNSRYKDTAMLEKPPILALQKTQQNAVIDDSVEPKKQLGGLDEKVILLDEKPQKLLLKLPVMDAWRVLGTALRQSDIKVTDYDKNKHLYYVSYKSQGGLSSLMGFNKDVTEVIYLLMLEPKEGETLISVSLASNHEQRESANNNPDGVYENPAEDSEGLIEHLFHVLRDDVKTE